MWHNAWMRSALVLSALLSLTACHDNTPASDVRGNYAIAFDDRLTIKLDVGGAKQEQTGTEHDVVSFQVNGQPVTLDLGAFCAKEEVKCPSEVLWNQVSIDQPNIAAHNPNTHVLNVIDNRVHEPPPGVAADVVAGLVDANDKLTLLVGGDSRGNGDCGLLALSIAEGRFTHEGEEVVQEPAASADAGTGDLDGGSAGAADAGFVSHVTFPTGAPVNGVAEGTLRVGYLGLCAFGPAVLGATLELSTGYTGTRTGELDPPPFTPVDPESVPDGTVDAGTPDVDGGTPDAG